MSGGTEERISMRQMVVLLAVALLAPATGALPRQLAAAAGGWSWAAPLLALPAVWGLVWVLRHLCRGRGLAQALEGALGRPLGRALTLGYLLWGLALLAEGAADCVARLVYTGQFRGAWWLLLAALMGLTLRAARGRYCALGRSAEIFYLILAAVLGSVLLLSLLRVEGENLLPQTVREAAGLPRATLNVLAVLGQGTQGAALAGTIAPRKGDARRVYGGTAVFCLLLCAVQTVILGCFGPPLAAKLTLPFFAMTTGVGVPGAFGRIEAVVAALWVLSDLTLLALLALACCTLAKGLLPMGARRTAAFPVAALAAVGAGLLLLSPHSGAELARSVMAGGNLIFGFALPVLALLALRVRSAHM